MAKKLLLNKRIILFFIFWAFSFHGNAQTFLYEKWVIEHYFYKYIANIKAHVQPLLSEKELKALNHTEVFLDTDDTVSYTAFSNTDVHKITFSSNLVRYLVKFSVLEQIERNPSFFNRKRFSMFFISNYPYLTTKPYPEEEAELTSIQMDSLFKICEEDKFSFTITKKILFVYLHEFYHQLQNYNTVYRKIDEKRIPQSVKDSLLLNLEFDADRYALDKIANLHIDSVFDPTEYSDVLTFFAEIKENYFFTSEQIVDRILNYYYFCFSALNCKMEISDDTICNKVLSNIVSYKILQNFYLRISSTENLENIRNKAFIDSDLISLYNLGDFYFKGTSKHVMNIDSALLCYETASHLPQNGALYGAKDEVQYLNIVEYCCLMAGKIYQFKLLNLNKSLEYYEKAKSISLMFPQQYYIELNKKIKEQISK